MRYRPILALASLVAVPVLAAPASGPPRKTVGVLRFENNTGDERYDNLGRALAAMMTSDLSVVEEIQLVERERLEELVAEMDFQQSAYVDASSARTVGMMVGAEYLVTGAFITVEPEMRLDTRVVRVETTEVVKTAEVTGDKDQLFDLQQRLADQLVDGLALALTEGDRERLRARQEANRIDHLETALAFSRALCLMDNGAFVDAFEAMKDVQQAAPASAIVQVTLDHLKGRAEDVVKNQLKERADRAIGNLFGRRRAPEREAAVPAC